MGAQHKVTIKDIARVLKLSVSTVSRALRNSPDIKEETRVIVKELAAELNYSPNPIALSLKEKNSRIIGVIVPEIANNFCSATIAGIEDIAYSKGYHVVIFQSHQRYEREVINTQLLLSRRIDGLIISLSNETNQYDHIKNLVAEELPLVMFDRVCDDIRTHKVVVDDYQGAFNATEHLILQGTEKIMHVTISAFLSITKNRLRGYADALKKYGIPLRQEWVIHYDPVNSEQAIRTILLSADRPDAIFASTEQMTLLCLKVINDLQLKIPAEIALAGFSDNPINKYLHPSLTAVRQPTFDIGQRAAELLIELIENTNGSPQFKTIELKTSLDIQASSLKRKAIEGITEH